MANQTASPEEARIAKKKLAEMGPAVYTPPNGTTYMNSDPFGDLIMTYWFNGKKHEIRRSDLLKNAQYAQPSGMGFNPYGTVAFTQSYTPYYDLTKDGPRPSFQFRPKKK